jgi:WhiB family redox-sensing transcriptional regulator
VTTPDWRVSAACLGKDTELFFGRDGERETERLIRDTQAKAICATCPVTAECGAFGATQAYGTWGGETEGERRARRRRELRHAAAARRTDREAAVA